MRPTIRKAKPEDATALSGLCAEHAAFEKADFESTDHIERLAGVLFLPDSPLTIFIAESAGEIIGFASCTEDVSTWAAKRFLHMDCLFVCENARGKSIGAQLFAAVKSHAVQRGLTEIQWQTPDWNEQAIAFYQKLGAKASPKLRFTLAL